MSDIIKDKNKVLSFALLKIEKGREKICKCNPPHYEIDTVNRIVTCTDCGATLDPFIALVSLAEHIEKYSEYQKEALQRVNTYREMADKEFRRRMRNRVFKEMDNAYHKDLYPNCPKCGELIDPMKITQYTSKKFYKECDTD